jgi:hypothetical protein
MNINWDESLLHFHPQSIEPAANGIPLPYYGNYGGPLWTAGEVGGTTPPLPANEDPFSVDPKPLDNLDAAFYLHDLAYKENLGAPVLPDDDFELLQTIYGLQFTNPDAPNYGGDMEASLYAGLASLSYIGLLAFTPGALDQLDDAEVSALPIFAVDAIQNFEAGLEAVPDEGRSLHGALHVFEAKYLPLIQAEFDLII